VAPHSCRNLGKLPVEPVIRLRGKPGQTPVVMRWLHVPQDFQVLSVGWPTEGINERGLEFRLLGHLT